MDFKRGDMKQVIVPCQHWLTQLRTDRGDEWESVANEARAKYIKVMKNDETVVGSMHVNEMLDVLGMFHSVTLLPKSWSSFQDYKCTCSDGHKYCVCEHGLLLTYITNRKVKIPAEFQNTKVAQRMVQFRGRPKKGRNPQRRLALEDVIHVSSATDQAVEQEAELEDDEVPEIGRAHV